MKKTLLIVMFLSLVLVQNSFADLNQSGTGSITCGAAAGSTLDIQLSPNVFAGYSGLQRSAIVGGAFDFFIIATYHSAGSRVFASAQTLTKIYKADTDSANDLPTLYGQVPTTVADAESEDQWSGDVWSAL